MQRRSDTTGWCDPSARFNFFISPANYRSVNISLVEWYPAEDFSIKKNEHVTRVLNTTFKVLASSNFNNCEFLKVYNYTVLQLHQIRALLTTKLWPKFDSDR